MANETTTKSETRKLAALCLFLLFATFANALYSARVFAISGPTLECFEDRSCLYTIVSIDSAHDTIDAPYLFGRTYRVATSFRVSARLLLARSIIREARDAWTSSDASYFYEERDDATIAPPPGINAIVVPL